MNRSQQTKQVKYNCGGKTKRVRKMAKGGQCRGGGAATRGKKFNRSC